MLCSGVVNYEFMVLLDLVLLVRYDGSVHTSIPYAYVEKAV